MKNYKVFVYGTLKQGFGNNYLLSNAKLLGEYITKDKFVMLGEYGFPYLTLPEDENDPEAFPVKGELYHIDENTKEHLDCLEGVDCDFYYHHEIEDGTYMYLNRRDGYYSDDMVAHQFCNGEFYNWGEK